MGSAEGKKLEEFKGLFKFHYPDITSGEKPFIVLPDDMPRVTLSPEFKEELARFDPGRLDLPTMTGTGSLPWSDPKSDPMKDLKDAYEALGCYTFQDVARFPTLRQCSKCGTVRTKREDPWITLKHCPNCGHVDLVPPTLPTPGPAPTTISWPEVQRLLIGILRQVEDNKVQIHPSEFDLTSVTFYQETNPDTGIVTIWFEKSDPE